MVKTAIILAAGRGSRLAKLTNDQPKCRTKLFDKPLIEYQIAALQKAGMESIVIVTGYKSNELEKYGTARIHNSTWANTNMVHSLYQADEILTNEPVIISYSDIFYSSSTVASLMEAEGCCVISYDPEGLSHWEQRFDDPLSDAETFKINENGQLTEIGKKPSSKTEVHGQYMGLLKFSPMFWNSIKKTIFQDAKYNIKSLDMTSLLQIALTQNHTVNLSPVSGKWGEVDTPEDIEFYEKFYENLDSM